ncbi:DUF4276 family protein [Pedobacter aquae]|uniref:DUF4276 family protein n=1 Tax=Pedobacter aquae TaxID=2605747 RepID=A0A5C0VJ55_9SPHI|nr:DUF4276 family protein [Pedobacter aquae]QEK51034.1 DUF4276 family protein [Pedobacter aquae]
MSRLVFIVEGDTEIILVQNLIVPYFINKGFNNPIHAQTIISNRKQHKKGGVVGYDKFKNEVKRTLAQGNVIVTTFIDFFRIPTDFPSYTTDSSLVDKIENAIHTDFNNHPNFIPYIQLHELEALMFSNIAGFDLVIDDQKSLDKIKKIIDDYPNPEDINNSPATAPSKRLEKIYNYDKTGDGEMIFEMIGIDAIIEKCPRFANWLKVLEERLS